MPAWLVLLIAVYALLIVVANFARRGPRSDMATGLVWIAVRVYMWLFHRTRYEGLGNIPPGREVGPLIIVANHTAGIDPFLVHAAVPFFVRWMMVESMMIPWLKWFWDWLEIVPVARGGKELASARLSIRAVKDGAVLGIFPEGGLERPARTLMPFAPGVGLIIAKTGAPVLPFVIEGAPFAEKAWGSILRFSRPRVRIMPVIDYSKSGLKPEQIAADLQRRYEEWTGWPVNTEGGPRAAQRRTAAGSARIDSSDGAASFTTSSG